VVSPRRAAEMSVEVARAGKRVAFVFGNEKTGLDSDDVALCTERVRIPMAADQPSINLAQAVQIIAYELFVAGLAARGERPVRGEPA
jgi:tRNA (cytidine32/uridine32-2'-O)-methyltransferase